MISQPYEFEWFSGEEFKEKSENLHKESLKLKRIQENENVRFYESVRSLPMDIGNTVGVYDRDRSQTRNRKKTILMNSPEWKHAVHNYPNLYEYHIKERQEQIERSQQFKQVEKIKEITSKKEISDKDIESIVAYTGDKIGKRDRFEESWIVLPNGRIIKTRNGKIVNKTKNNFKKEINTLEITNVYEKDLTDKERYFLAFAMAYGSVHDFNLYQSGELSEGIGGTPKGILMDRSRFYAIIDRDICYLDFSDYEQVSFSDLKPNEGMVKNSKGVEKLETIPYSIGEGRYSADSIHEILKFAYAKEIQYKDAVMYYEESKPFYIEMPDTDKRIGFILASMQLDEKEEEYDSYSDDDDAFEEDDF